MLHRGTEIAHEADGFVPAGLSVAVAALIQTIVQEPILVDPDRVDLVRANLAYLARHPRGYDMLADVAADDNFWPSDPNDWRASIRPYNVKNGILQIPVMGVLLNRFGYQFGSWATGYTYIEKALERGLADANVRGIAFIHDSPGGVVAGNFELNDKIHSARGQKPMRAFAADHSYSASYSLASAAHSITVTRSGGVGSIGVVTTHIEYSGMLKEIGVTVTFVFAGKHKVEGNSYEPLTDDAKSRMQERIDRIYSVFTAAVARNRGMDEKAIRGTEALTYDAQDAVKVGLADKVGALDAEMVIFSSELDNTGDENMAVDATADKGVPQAQHDQAVATARTEGKAEGVAEGLKAQKDRINAIIASDAAKKRPKAALSAALSTNMTVEEATTFLGGLAEEKAEKPQSQRNHFDEAMGDGAPKVQGGDGGEGGEGGGDRDHTKSILAAYQSEGGSVRKRA